MANYDSTFEKEYEAAKQRVAKKTSFEEEYEAAKQRVQGQKQTAPVSVVKQDIPQIQQQNYGRMQEIINKSTQADLDDVNRQIQTISGYGVGADRSGLQSLLQRKDELEKQLKTGRYDEDLTALERLQLTAQGIGESYNYAPGVLVDTAVGAIKGEKVDMNSDAIKGMQRAQQASQQATYGMGDGAAFLYNTGASIVENASMLPLAALPGGQAAVLAMMGSKAAAQKAVEVGEKGGSAKSALLRGLGSGAIEAATEKLPLDNITKLIKGDVGKSIIKNMLVQAGEEATEEGIAYLANLMLDKIAKDPDAKFSLQELGASMLAGGISGGVMGGGASLIGSNVRRNSNQQDVADTNDGEIAKDTNVPGKTAENTVLQSTAKTAERAELENEVKRIVGIDTRSEVEKVSEKQREYVDNVQKLVESGIAPAEHLEQAQRKAEKTIKEAVNKQANLDYQRLDADSGRIRQEAVDSGKGKLIENIERFTNERGFKVKYYSADADSVGNGFIDGDTIYINVQDSNVMAKTAIHETIHGLRGNNGAEYTKLYNSIMNYAEQYRALHDVADRVMDTYTNPDSVAYSSVLDDAGNVDADKLGEEVLCKLCEEVIKDPESFIKNVDGNRTVLDAVADLLRKIKNSLAITLTKSESAKLDNAVMAIERYVRGGAAQTEKKYSVHYDVNDRPFVEIDNDILAGVPQSKWVDTVKGYLYTHDVNLDNDVVKINAITRGEYTNSKSAQKLNDTLKKAKWQFVNNIDEIIKTAVPYVSEKARHNNFSAYERGTVDIRINDSFYEAEVVIGVSKDNNKVFYDIVNIRNKKITPSTVQQTKPLKAVSDTAKSSRANRGVMLVEADGNSSSTTTNNNVSQFTENDNGNNLSKNSGKQSSLSVSADSGNAELPDELKGKTIRERIEARANSGVTAKSRNVQARAENYLAKAVANAFGVKHSDKVGVIKDIVKDISAEIKAKGYVSRNSVDRLVDMAFDKGFISDNDITQQYPKLKKELRMLKIKYNSVSEVYRNMRKEYLGKLTFAKEGTDADILYQQLSDSYANLFPADIENPEDQIVQIGKVYDMLDENESSLAEYYGEHSEEMKELVKEDLRYAIGKYAEQIGKVNRFEDENRVKQGKKAVMPVLKMTKDEFRAAQDKVYQAQKLVDQLSRDSILTDSDNAMVNTLVAGGDPDLVKGSNRNEILALYAAKKAVKDARAPIVQYQQDIRNARYAKADNLLKTFRSWKDKGWGLGYRTETFERNIRDIVPDKTVQQELIDTFVNPVHKAEADGVRLKKRLREQIKALGIDTSTKEKLYEVVVEDENNAAKLQVNESGLVQLYGEKKISEAQLKKIGADVDKIKNAVGVFKEIYAELYDLANDALLRNGYAPLGKIDDYFPHFTEENDTVLSRLAARAGFEVQTNRLPTSIAGITETFKPGKRWWGNMQHRTGDTTLFDAVTGFDQYIDGAASIIYQTDNIQNLRAFENRLRYLASDKGLREQLNDIDNRDITAEEKQDAKDRLYAESKEMNLEHFVAYLREYTNNLAGKKSIQDRGVEHDIGRGIYTVSKALESRIASNMIGANIGSALTNFIPIAQAKSAIKTKHLVNAMNDTLKAFYGHDNGFENESDFLTNRFGSEKLVYTRAQRISNMAGWLMNICDRFTSNVVIRARYLQNIDNGMSSDEAMADANSFAAGLIADRSKGAVPLVFERKNPIVKAVTMFQVEQNNQLRYLVKDLPKDFEKKGVTALVWAIVQYSVASWLYNELYKIFVGRRPAFDPIDIGFGIVKDAQAVAKGEMKTSAALTNAVTAISEELPFVSGLVGGGRIPINSALPDAAEVIKLFDSDVSADKKKSIAKKELTKPLWYLASPTAGGQIKKVAEAAELYGKNDGVQYSVQSDGSKKAQFAVDKTAGNVLQSALFGKWSSDEAQEYIDNGFKGLSKKQTEAFDGLKGTGMSNKDAWAAADWKAADTDGNNSIKTEEARAYLDSKDFTKEQKAILFSCMCPNVKNNPYK